MEKIVAFYNDLPQTAQLVLAGLGAVILVSKLVTAFQAFLGIFILTGDSLSKYGKPGSWAVVTGASDGLGKEFATQLAAKKFNIVLVSRTQSKLDTLSQELQTKYPEVQTKTLSMDFSRDDESDYTRLAETVKGLDVAILINNVGQSHSIPVPFLETTREELQSIVTINCLGTLKVTQVVAPIMKQRKRGLILTMGSFAGWIPTPYLATYSGSKAFLQHWSTSLAEELKGDGVHVQLVLSYLITTAMSKIRRPSAMIPRPQDFVRSTLSKVGLDHFQNYAYTYTPWFSHAALLWIVENTLGAGNSLAVWYNHVIHKDIRTRALKKAEREAKKQ
ncbi:estradiol 17-beta-dehydrogenase 12-B [Plectosphaerella plurivora]|uniref:Very-long-chain 3-oxoacyl-CoA reductase n=1 Tax=Plectosphaerella plurivora TaxID=936078 RepID=A0A9P9A9J5_9PEZI|nr:estradiol 17-beta-dehydrogenase 12-B [Plectosphaerella plurivora]